LADLVVTARSTVSAQRLVEEAARLAIASELRSMDALHLVAALMLPSEDLLLAT
jgi:hypothetical protein